MSKVLTFSRTFPSYHPRKGEPTYFVEKIIRSLDIPDHKKMTLIDLYAENFDLTESEFLKGACNPLFDHQPKHHTIRAGHRFKVGDWFSPRVWSGKPYNSKQIIIAPDIQVKKVCDFKIKKYLNDWYIDFGSHSICFGYEGFSILDTLAKNDGLTRQDLLDWFKYPSSFDGQIIFWNENINY